MIKMGLDNSMIRLSVFECLKDNPWVTRRSLRKKYAELVLLGCGERCPKNKVLTSLVPVIIPVSSLKSLEDEGIIQVTLSAKGDLLTIARGLKWRGSDCVDTTKK